MVKYFILAVTGAFCAAAADSVLILALTTGITVLLMVQERS